MIEGPINPGDLFRWQPNPNEADNLSHFHEPGMNIYVVECFQDGFVLRNNGFGWMFAIGEDALRRNASRLETIR
jgi:hypothetical protein